MKQKDVKDFCNYEVYEIVDGKVDTICLCKDIEMADLICRLFASKDPKNDDYYYTSIVEPNTFVPGGGWYISYHKNKEGKLVRNSLG